MLLMLYFLILIIKTVSTNEIFKYTVEEKSPINTFIADLSNELKIQTNATYDLFELLPINKNLFTIHNQTGHLMTRAYLDREKMCLKQQCSCKSCEIMYQLIIYFQQKIIYKIIEIQIKDRNDHSPIFDSDSNSYAIHIKENVPLGYRIVLPIANDPDEGSNGVQSYRIDGMYSEDFDVDYSSIDIPYLIVRSSLDVKRIPYYSFKLMALDNRQQFPSQSGSIQLNIRIINESLPVFGQSVYSVDVREDTSIGTTILNIEAISDYNEKIFYEILTESPFIIDRLTGNIQLKQLLDYERETLYRLTVKAYQNLIPTYAIVFVRVIDINDNPVFIQTNVEGNITLKQTRNDKNIISIPEDTPIGTTLAHIILSDLDSSANGNPYLQLTTIQPPLPFIYKLIYQNKFQNVKVYSLVLHNNLDRETRSMYNNIHLIAYDSGTPTLHSKLSFILNITDVNDCIPQIKLNSTIYDINENNPFGLIIDKLIGSDCDLGVNGEYEYSLINKTDLLILNSQTGQLILNQTIDFESINNNKTMTTIDLEYFIEIKDHGQPSLSSQTKIILRIHDINDNSPEFDQHQSYNWTFSKSSLQSGKILGRIIVDDSDSGLQGIVHSKIQSFDSCLILDITSLGYVHVLSYNNCLYSTYTFEITATDFDALNPRSTKQTLIINIDLNETNTHSLPQLLPLNVQQIFVDINSIGNLSFLIDITHNNSIQPRIYLNNTDLLTCWNVTPTGEIRLMAHPYAMAYKLILNIIDEYTQEYYFIKLQIDICNSSMINSCQKTITDNDKKENQFLLVWAMSLALIITCICVFIFSIMTCLCCRKQTKNIGLTANRQHLMQSSDDFQSEKTFKTSTSSTNREEDRDSACIVATNSSSLSSGIIPIQTNSYHHNQCETLDGENYQSSAYFYDLKLAEFIRNNQNPPCVYINAQPCQSLSSDCGFNSSGVSPSSTSSSSLKLNPTMLKSLEWSIEMGVDHTPNRQTNKRCFISTHECVV